METEERHWGAPALYRALAAGTRNKASANPTNLAISIITTVSSACHACYACCKGVVHFENEVIDSILA